MNKPYDIVVIGAGPAGLSAALAALADPGKPTVLLVDKQAPWEHPIPCAEGVFGPAFREVMQADQAWIRFEVDTAVFHSPNNATISYRDKNPGYILDRARMQKDLAERCRGQGATLWLDQRAIDVGIVDEHATRAVRFAGGNTVRARVVIDCSGPLSTLGKNEKISWKPADLEVAMVGHLRGVDVETGAVHVYAGRNVAPGAYAWSFPRGPHGVNVGVIVGSRFRKGSDIRGLFESFAGRLFPRATVERRFGATIPCSYGKPRIAVTGFIKAGDAASTVNPITRAGISEGMLSGKLAAEAAVKMLGAVSGKQMALACTWYEKAWFEKRGKRHAKLAKVKHALAKVPDSDYDVSAAVLSKVPLQNLTMSKIFTTSLARFPRLVWAMRHAL